MKRRNFIATTALGSIGLSAMGSLKPDHELTSPSSSKKILATGGSLDSRFISYIRDLTGKKRPRLCFLPTASADDPRSAVYWYQRCSSVEATPFVLNMFISSYRMKEDWSDILLSMDGIIVGGGNTLNMMAIWKAQGIDKILKEAWDKGIVMGGGSAGSLCWFEEGTTDSRPKVLTKIECLGFIKGSHSPHYDAEAERRPRYHELIKNGTLKPGYAVDNNAAILFEDEKVSKVVALNDKSFAYYVEKVGDQITETKFKPDIIL